jgi:thymidylate kinase
MIVSFSGIDGAGKSTQIRELQFWLRQCGMRTKLLAFWDDVAAFRRFREFISHLAFKGDQGVGTAEKPLNRRDKNVTIWPVAALRYCFYLLDAVSLCLTVRATSKKSTDILIFDRYIYDELANLSFASRFTRIFTWLVLKLVPKPHVAYVIDADPDAARTRKPEYPLSFLRLNREAYINLAEIAGNITVIASGSVEMTQIKIRQTIVRELSAPKPKHSELSALR